MEVTGEGKCRNTFVSNSGNSKRYTAIQIKLGQYIWNLIWVVRIVNTEDSIIKVLVSLLPGLRIGYMGRKKAQIGS